MKTRYDELRAKFPDTFIPYDILLLVQEWDDRRNAILMRDDFTCTACKWKPQDRQNHGLNVHHCYYVFNKLPWEYPDDALVTLCAHCHQTYHEKHSAPRYEERDGKLVEVERRRCLRCQGTGYLPEYDYHMDGICFGCWGTGDDSREFLGNPPNRETLKKMLNECLDVDTMTDEMPF